MSKEKFYKDFVCSGEQLSTPLGKQIDQWKKNNPSVTVVNVDFSLQPFQIMYHTEEGKILPNNAIYMSRGAMVTYVKD